MPAEEKSTEPPTATLPLVPGVGNLCTNPRSLVFYEQYTTLLMRRIAVERSDVVLDDSGRLVTRRLTDPVADAPVADAPEPVADAPEPVADAPEPVADAPEHPAVEPRWHYKFRFICQVEDPNAPAVARVAREIYEELRVGNINLRESLKAIYEHWSEDIGTFTPCSLCEKFPYLGHPMFE